MSAKSALLITPECGSAGCNVTGDPYHGSLSRLWSLGLH